LGVPTRKEIQKKIANAAIGTATTGLIWLISIINQIKFKII
jgi:hypothetical protein